MDAHYLKQNVNEALAEALTSMAVALPDDRIEYLGRYLLQYASRREKKIIASEETSKADELARGEQIKEEELNDIEVTKKAEIEAKKALVPEFISSLTSDNTKQELMDKVTNFLADYLSLPGVYIAVKKTIGETDTLHYYSANVGQEHVVGKKLVKVVEEGDEVPARQGCSFDAFKIPEVVEEEPNPDEPVDENAPPKPPPKPLPLKVTNVMREKRCKFFGIPKLGSYVAVPLISQTVDHDAGFATATAEDGTVSNTMNKIPLQMIIGMDTIGNYRNISDDEIQTVELVGNALLTTIDAVETKIYETHVAFLDSYKDAPAQVAALPFAGIPDQEAAALAAVATELAVDPAIDPPPEPAPESLKVHKETASVLAIWSSTITSPEFTAPFKGMEGHSLPTPQAVATLLYVLGVFVGIEPAVLKDACGDITWNKVKTGSLPSFLDKVKEYNPAAVTNVSKDSSLASLKTICETSNLFDASIYPPILPTLPFLAQWLQKAIAAREAAINYYKEVKNEIIEVIV
jgi:hypothetical protein